MPVFIFISVLILSNRERKNENIINIVIYLTVYNYNNVFLLFLELGSNASLGLFSV